MEIEKLSLRPIYPYGVCYSVLSVSGVYLNIQMQNVTMLADALRAVSTVLYKFEKQSAYGNDSIMSSTAILYYAVDK